MATDAQLFRKVMGKFATGVTVISVSGTGAVKGMTANSFTSVSLEPPLVLVCVDYRARTLDLLRGGEHFGISVLEEHQQPVSDFFTRFEQEPDVAQRLGIRYRISGGAPVLEDCLATIGCRKVAAHEAGDHIIFVGEVQEMAARDGRPLLFYAGRYHRIGDPS